MTSEDFFSTVVEGHILAAVMEVFGISSLDDQPSPAMFPEDSLGMEPCQKKELAIPFSDGISKSKPRESVS